MNSFTPTTESSPSPSRGAQATRLGHKQEANLKILSQVSLKLQELLTSADFYNDVLELIQKQFHYYSAQFWTAASDGSATLRSQAGAYDTHLKIGHRLQVGAGITGYVLQTKRSYLSNNVALDPRFTNLSVPVMTCSQLCVPVMKDQEVIATLNIESDETDAFGEEDRTTLEAVAAQLAVTVTNRRLFEETRDFNQKLQKAVTEKTVELSQAHERIVEQQKLLEKENKALKTLVNKDRDVTEMVGKSPAIENILTMVDKIAPTMATVLIQGESGTGKELIARRLHFKSDRAGSPYVTVNCGALQESLLESELFGHEKGSFTGATSQKAGLVETADSGTLFLDEIGEMTLGIQSKLLRFLQEGEFYRIGGKRPLKVHVRILSATNRDLEQEVRAGRFREDLFYRLNTITLRMPPLRKRKEDIPALVEYFLKNSRFGGQSHVIKKIHPKVYDALSNYSWPGNIRELQNTIERMKILSENNEFRLDDVPLNIRMPSQKNDVPDFTATMPLEEVEKKHILRALTFHQGNKTKTAQGLGITIKTLYNKLHRFGVIKSEPAQEGKVASHDNEEI